MAANHNGGDDGDGRNRLLPYYHVALGVAGHAAAAGDRRRPWRADPRSGTLPLGQRPQARQDYRFFELKRWIKRTGLPLNLRPTYFPLDERPAHGAIEAAVEAGLDALTLAEAVGRAIWIEEKNPADPDQLAAILNAAGAPDGAALIARGGEPDIEARLTKNAEDALAAGAFGFPWYVFRGEPFWGQDRLDFLAEAVSAAQ